MLTTLLKLPVATRTSIASTKNIPNRKRNVSYMRTLIMLDQLATLRATPNMGMRSAIACAPSAISATFPSGPSPAIPNI